jgi:hypothetical protein
LRARDAAVVAPAERRARELRFKEGCLMGPSFLFAAVVGGLGNRASSEST